MLPYKLAFSGHDVNVIACNKCLAQRQARCAIVSFKAAPAPVKAHGIAKASIAYDVAVVTVFPPSMDAVLSTACASVAKPVVPLSKTMAPLAPLREAIGAQRFVFQFPTF